MLWIHIPTFVMRLTWIASSLVPPPHTYFSMTDFDTLAHPRGAAGKFTDRTHSVPERGLSHPVRHLLHNYGDEFLLTPGIIDDNARHVFTEGQALALAAGVSRATG